MNNLSFNDNHQITKAFIALYTRTVEQGATHVEAVKHVFDQLQKDYPTLLAAWIEDNLHTN